MKKKLILVGAGLHNCTLAFLLKNKFDITIYEERNEIGGLCHSETTKEGIEVHKYGPHVLHTNSRKLWDFVNSIVPFTRFQLKPVSQIGEKIYSFPINLMTLHQVYGITTPEQAKERLAAETLIYNNSFNKDNFESAALAAVGTELYEMFFKGYTRKMWGKNPAELPASTFKRLPVRVSFDNDYFPDTYEGIPIDGYTMLMKCLTLDVKIIHRQFTWKDVIRHKKIPVIFTGNIEQLLDVKPLPYRSVEFVTQKKNVEDYQGCAVKYSPEFSIPWTRCTEHKHFIKNNYEIPRTWVTWEIPSTATSAIKCYPIRDAEDKSAEYDKYKNAVDKIYPNLILAGRLGLYRYMNMDEVILNAFALSERLCQRKGL